MAEFLSKATGTAVDWVQMPGMKVFNFLNEIHNSFMQEILDLVFSFLSSMYAKMKLLLSPILKLNY